MTLEATEENDAAVQVAMPADLGLLVTLAERVHCRRPMQQVKPVNPAEAGASTWGPAATYRCICGFTIDVPAGFSDFNAS